MMATCVIIPARLASSRLPNKPLAIIGGKPMIAHVWERAREADIGPVYIACCSQKIADVMQGYGAEIVMTDPELPSGTDRVFAALQSLSKQSDVVVNLQGDLPFVSSDYIRQAAMLLSNSAVDIGTLVAPMTKSDHDNPAAVKAALGEWTSNEITNKKTARAIYFSRLPIPYGAAQLYHHVGIYAYRLAALKRFVSLPTSALEEVEKLEQLRALEAGMRIDVELVDYVPHSVDTPKDLECAQGIWKEIKHHGHT